MLMTGLTKILYTSSEISGDLGEETEDGEGPILMFHPYHQQPRHIIPHSGSMYM